jgi:hypothetical protein
MQHAMALIETAAFDAATGVTSDLDTFLKAATGAPVREIMRAARSPEAQLVLAKRILELADRDFDVRYLNPADTAVTVYLWILANVRPPLAEAVATMALGLRNGWWAPRIARRILAADSGTAPATTISVPHSTATINLGTAARQEPAISALGFARHVREATVLAEGSVGSSSSGTVTSTYKLSGTIQVLGSAGNADTVNDSLATAA